MVIFSWRKKAPVREEPPKPVGFYVEMPEIDCPACGGELAQGRFYRLIAESKDGMYLEMQCNACARIHLIQPLYEEVW